MSEPRRRVGDSGVPRAPSRRAPPPPTDSSHSREREGRRRHDDSDSPSSRRKQPSTSQQQQQPRSPTTAIAPRSAEQSLRKQTRREDIKSIIMSHAPPPYKPVDHKYVRQLMSVITSELVPDQQAPTKADFLTEEGYYNWLDAVEKSSSLSFANMSVEYLRQWDVTKPLLYEEVSQSATALVETTVTLVFRVIQARNLLPDIKGRSRNIYAVIEYYPAAGTQSKSSDTMRYETAGIDDTLSPVWNQQVTFTVHDIADSATVTVYGSREKNGLFSGNDVKEDYLGSVRVRMSDLVKKCAQSGYYSSWQDLGTEHAPKEKLRGREVSGSVLVEAEMSGMADVMHPTAHDQSSQIKQLQHKLIVGKVNLKSMYQLIVQAVIFRDMCIPPGKQLFGYDIKEIAFTLSSNGAMVLSEFSRVWMVSPLVSQLKYLDCVFRCYQIQRLHARALTSAYQSLYEQVFKSGKIWLPEHEKPTLIQLMKRIENYTTQQIAKFKIYFPLSKTVDGALDKNEVAHIVSSIDCALLVTRMIDKNDLFLEALQKHDAARPTSNSHDDEPQTSDSDPFAQRRRRPSRAHDEPRDEIEAAITQFDYKNGKFRFSEKLSGLVRAGAAQRYGQLAELAIPAVSGTDRELETALNMVLALTQLLIEEVSMEQQVYSQGFEKDNKFDLVAVTSDVYVRYYVLELENLRQCVSDRMKRNSGSMQSASGRITSSISNLSLDADATLSLASEDEFIKSGFELMRLIKQLHQKLQKHKPNDSSLLKSASGWFTHFVERSISASQAQLFQWMDKACNLDSLTTAEQSNLGFRSTSAQDALSSLTQSIKTTMDSFQLIYKIDPTYEAVLVTRLSFVIRQAIDAYCVALERQVLTMQSNASQSSIATAVWDYFGGSKQESTANAQSANTQTAACSIALADLDFIMHSLKKLYEAMDGARIGQAVAVWRQTRSAQKSSNSGLTGLVKVSVIAACNIKLRPVIYGKTYPAVVIKNGEHAVAMTRPAVGADVTRYSNANVSGASNMNPDYFVNGADYLASLVDATDLKVSVVHMPDANTLLVSKNSQELAVGVLELSARVVRRDSPAVRVDMQPQGYVFVKVHQKSTGIATEPSSGKFGVAGVEDVEHNFSAMKLVLINSRYRLARILCSETTALIWQKVVKTFEFPDAIKTVMDDLNDLLSSLSQFTDDKTAQQVIYTIWQMCILFPLLQVVETAAPTTNMSNVQAMSMMLLEFFHAGGEGLGLPIALLRDCSSYDVGDAARGVKLGKLLFSQKR